MTVKERRAARIAAGLCARCGEKPLVPGKQMCKECAERERRCAEARRIRLKASGLCVQCGSRPAVQGYTRCEVCRQDTKSRSEKRRKLNKAAGLCAECGKNPPLPGRVICEVCQARQAERHSTYTRIERCVDCGQPAVHRSKRCLACLTKRAESRGFGLKLCPGDCLTCPLPDCVYEKHADDQSLAGVNRRYRERKAAGLCAKCGKVPVAEGQTQCPDCRARVSELARERRRKRHEEGRCPRCGGKLLPGARYCEVCREKARRGAREISLKRKTAGLCTRCGKAPAMEGRAYCAGCAEKGREYNHTWYDKNRKSAGYRIDPYGRKIPAKGGRK